MRAYVPAYRTVNPKSLQDALTRIGDAPEDYTILAGGTDLMVNFNSGNLPFSGTLLNIFGLSELRKIKVSSTHVTLGALVSYGLVRQHRELGACAPCLIAAAKQTGGIAIQNRGTVGGNIMNASPAADTPPALLAYGAEVELASASGRRWIPYEDFHLGYKKTAAKPGELLTSVRFLKPKREGKLATHFYRKVGTRNAQAISKVVIAAYAETKKKQITEARVSFGSVAPMTIRAGHLEKLLLSTAIPKINAELVAEAVRLDGAPIDDIRSTQSYRNLVAEHLAQEFFELVKNKR